MTQDQRTGLAIGVGVLLSVLGLYLLGAFEWLELRSYDLTVTTTPLPPLHTPILLVRIDEESEVQLNVRAQDIPRSTYAEAVRRLARAGAAVIGLDVIFSRPRDQEGDAALARAIEEAGHVILARYIGEMEHKTPLPEFRRGALGEGLINVSLDRDGVLRRVPLLALDYGDDGGEPAAVLAMSVEVARYYLDPAGEHELDLEHPEELRVGPLRIPYPDGQMRIHFYGPPATFPRLPFWKVVRGEFVADDVRGKIVLIGASAPSLHDYYQTPFTAKPVTVLGERGSDEARGVRMDGFEIHANAIQTILDQSYIHRSQEQWGLVPGLMLATGTAGIFLLVLSRKGPLVGTGTWLGLLAVLGVVAYVLFWHAHYWLDVVPLQVLVTGQFAAGLSYQRYLEARQRRQVQEMFGRYVSPRVVDRLVKNPELANPSGRKAQLTMFFSDVRGFTSMSEQLEPQEVQRLLSEYFSEMTRILFKYGGTLDKFMGDAVMAFFGDPEPQPDHARRAVLMALEMQEAVTRLNQKWAAEGRRTIGVGMGINTGEVTVGNLGSKDYMDYTVIGDAVNLACRIEQNAKAGDVLITQATYDEVKPLIEAEPLEPMRVKGKSEPIPVYRVLRARPMGS
jgi:adenylate cyclase